MGVSTDWNGGSKTLDITAGGARTAYVAETGKKQSGSVSVTLPSYKISVNGAQINNKEEKYPIFNYNGITYFPLTWAYAVDSFGWSYQWDAVNGLRIDTSSAPAPAPVEIIIAVEYILSNAVFWTLLQRSFRETPISSYAGVIVSV